ncbi:MAG: hypothetical protein ABIT01_15165, partial [Thermoanaerobaculia bacterium]
MRRGIVSGIALMLVLLSAPLRAQGPSVTLDRTGNDPLTPRTKIVLVVEPPVSAAKGRVQIFLGTSDVTELFERTGTRYRYRADLFPLPTGSSELIVLLLAPDGRTTPLGRVPIEVASADGGVPPA